MILLLMKLIIIDIDENDKALDLLNNKDGNKKILLRRMSIFSKIKNFVKKNVEKIVKKTI